MPASWVGLQTLGPLVAEQEAKVDKLPHGCRTHAMEAHWLGVLLANEAKATESFRHTSALVRAEVGDNMWKQLCQAAGVAFGDGLA